jgi:hypothetical protein
MCFEIKNTLKSNCYHIPKNILEKGKRKESYIVVHQEFKNILSYEIIQSLGCVYTTRHVYLAKFSNL